MYLDAVTGNLLAEANGSENRHALWTFCLLRIPRANPAAAALFVLLALLVLELLVPALVRVRASACRCRRRHLSSSNGQTRRLALFGRQVRFSGRHGSSTTGGSATGIMFGALRLAASCAALDVMQRWSGVELFQFAAAAY